MRNLLELASHLHTYWDHSFSNKHRRPVIYQSKFLECGGRMVPPLLCNQLVVPAQPGIDLDPPLV